MVTLEKRKNEMASSESLLQRIQSGGFLPLSLTIDPLQQILLEIMALIKDQDKEIHDLRGQIDGKADRDAFDGLQKMIDDKEKAAIEREKAIENLIGDKERDLLEKIKDTNDKLDNTNEKVDKNREACDRLNDDVKELRDRLSALEANAKPSDSNADDASLQDLRDEIAKLKESMKDFDENKDALKDLAQLKDALKDLERMKDALNDLDRLKDALNDLDKIRDALKELEQLRDGLKDLDQLREGLKDLERLKDGINDLEKLKDALRDLDELKQTVQNMKDLDKLKDAMKDLEQLKQAMKDLDDLYKLKDAMKDVEDLAKLKDALKKLEELSQRVKDIGDDLRNLSNEAVRRGDESHKKDEENIVVRPPPERDETNPRAVQRAVELGEDENGGRRGSGEGQSHRKMPLPDLVPEDLKEALRQLREELTHLRARVGDNEDKMNAKHNELDDQIKALWNAIEELKNTIAGLPEAIEDIKRDLASRPDKAMIERLFEKFKSAMNGLANSLGRKTDDSDKRAYATMDDIKRLENSLHQMNMEWEEAAAARKSTCCLSCGRPYRTVTGAITDEATLAVLGAAPISHLAMGETNKPCFVYGSDNELYYSSSPRGKTFVAPPRTPGSARH